MNIQAINNNSYSYNNNLKANKKQNLSSDNIAFKGNKAGFFEKLCTETYGKYLLQSDKVRTFCKWVAGKEKKDASRHFQVIGSFVTSSAYMFATLKNKEFDKKNANTLAINQGLGFLVPTAAAYFIDSKMENLNKHLEYSFVASQEKRIGKLSEEAKEIALKRYKNGVKGVRTLMSIITFTAVYRYLAPVAITPIANMVGNWFNSSSTKKAPAVAQTPETKPAA